MNDVRRLSGWKVLLLASPLLLNCGPAAARSWSGDRDVRIGVADGTVEVALRPDRGSALRLTPDGPHRWVFEGKTSTLVGGSYSIVLRNRTSERLKIVVGVDGVNVYAREVIAGSASEDVGSILSPWSERTLPGWQLDRDRAQRFVFSPPEWSEGEGRTDSQIGLVTVQVYREWQPRVLHHHDDSAAKAEPRSAPAPQEAHRHGADEAPAGGVAAAPASPPIGTTAGDDVDNTVRTVRFEAATSFPEAWATIDYGAAEYGRRPPPPPRYEDELLGLAVTADPDGTRVVAVAPGSAADRAGLEAEDVIVRIDTVFEPDPSTTRRILRAKDHGDYAFLRVRRGPHELAVKIRV